MCLKGTTRRRCTTSIAGSYASVFVTGPLGCVVPSDELSLGYKKWSALTKRDLLYSGRESCANGESWIAVRKKNIT